jgi:hypothetical protein
VLLPGEAVTEAPVVVFRPVPGDHVYVGSVRLLYPKVINGREVTEDVDDPPEVALHRGMLSS